MEAPLPVDEFGCFVEQCAIELRFFLIGECGIVVVFIEAVESFSEGVISEFEPRLFVGAYAKKSSAWGLACLLPLLLSPSVVLLFCCANGGMRVPVILILYFSVK